MRYAIIENNVVQNTVESDSEFASSQGWIPIPSDMDIGCTFDGTNWNNPNLLTSEVLLERASEEFRARRNLLLLESDWTQGKDIDDSISIPWATYRQMLRDLPQQESFPSIVIWPTKPQ